jgi:hypothetical protein
MSSYIFCLNKPEERLEIVYNALICAIILIGEEDAPVRRKLFRIYGEAMVLGGDEAPLRIYVRAWLVMPTIAISVRYGTQ